MSIDRTAERIPPQSIEAERSTLGSMLLERDAAFKAQEILCADDFYRDAHRIIWNAITALVDKGEPVDLVTVTDYLRNRDQLEKIGGVGYITGLVNTVPTAANVEYYARIVEEKSILRSVITSATEIVGLGYDETREAATVLDEAERQIFAIAQRRKSQSVVALKSILIPAFDRIEKIHDSQGGVTGLPTGYTDLDRLTSGLQPSDLIILAARPSMGKTTFALNIAQHASTEHKIPIALFSLEMAKEQLALKLLCAQAGVDMQRMRSGRLHEDDWPRLARALGVLSEAMMFVDDTPNITALEVRTKSRRIKAEHGLGLIVIDYLQLMQGRSRAENRQQEVTEISRSLKALARELHVPVIALSQLSRAVEQRASKIPTLADLRESGSLEQDADIVAFLYREDYYKPDTEKRNVTELHIAKHRNGPLGMVEFYFRKEFSTFEALDKEHEDIANM